MRRGTGGLADERKNRMVQRTITGIVSVALLLLVLYIRGWVFNIGFSIVAVIGCYEMISAFEKAGLHPVRWPVYAMAALMLPVYLLGGMTGIYLLACASCMLVMLGIVLRKQPQWPDAAASLSVLISVPLPLILLFPIIRIEPVELGVLMVLLVFVVALLGDTLAYFIGVAIGKHKMTPALSPKKTWEGSIAGLVGSVAGAVLLGMLGNTVTAMPAVWHFVIIGLIGGICGQLGDLSASLVKRYCGIKDFGSIFPGHGGILDRFDSILYVTYVVFGYCMISGLF